MLPSLVLLPMLAQTTAADPAASLSNLIQWGVLGIIVILMVWGKIAPGWVVDQLRKDLDAQRAENASLRKSLEEKVIPALERSTAALASAAARTERSESGRQ